MTPREQAVAECIGILKAARGGPAGVEAAAREAWRVASMPAIDYIAQKANVAHRTTDVVSERYRTSWRLKRWTELTLAEKRALGKAAKAAAVDPALAMWRHEFEALTVLGWL